jgi:hypothetical protein
MSDKHEEDCLCLDCAEERGLKEIDRATSSLDGPTGSAPSPEIVAALDLCHRLRDGAARMTRQQFRNCLKRSIGAGKDYADGVWISFENNPAAFLAHRQPQSQSHELLRVLLEITKEPNEVTDRPGPVG